MTKILPKTRYRTFEMMKLSLLRKWRKYANILLTDLFYWRLLFPFINTLVWYYIILINIIEHRVISLCSLETVRCFSWKYQGTLWSESLIQIQCQLIAIYITYIFLCRSLHGNSRSFLFNLQFEDTNFSMFQRTSLPIYCCFSSTFRSEHLISSKPLSYCKMWARIEVPIW